MRVIVKTSLLVAAFALACSAALICKVHADREALHKARLNALAAEKTLRAEKPGREPRIVSNYPSMRRLPVRPWWSQRRGADERTTVIAAELNQILRAICQYNDLFKELPTGDNKAIFDKLRGDNSQHTPVVELPRRLLSPDGSALDPWKTPLRIIVDPKDRIEIRSAGENKKFDDDDDEYIIMLLP